MLSIDSEHLIIPIHSPFQSFEGVMTKRTSLLWTLRTSEFSLQMEQCFYPGLLPEMTQEERRNLEKHFERLQEIDSCEPLLTLDQVFCLSWFSELRALLLPHHRFTPEYLGLAWLWVHFRPPCLSAFFEERTVPVSGLITNLEQASSLDLKATPHWKIKIARQDPQAEQHALQELFQRYPDHHFRLDANDGLDSNSLSSWLKFLRDYSRQIEWLESPCQDFKLWNAQPLGLPLAFDFRDPQDLQDLFKWNRLCAVVIKPSLLSLRESISILKKAQAFKLKGVLSSCFETQLGLEAIARLSTFCPYPSTIFHGLGTLTYVEPDQILTASLSVSPFTPVKNSR